MPIIYKNKKIEVTTKMAPSVRKRLLIEISAEKGGRRPLKCKWEPTVCAEIYEYKNL